MTVIVLMGTSCSGKSTVGSLLAKRFGLPFIEASEPSGILDTTVPETSHPHQDTDPTTECATEIDWLAANPGRGAVVSCASLRLAERSRLRAVAPDAFFVHLDVSEEELLSRAAARTDHAVVAARVRAQWDFLEALQPGEAGAVVQAEDGPRAVTDRVATAVRWHTGR